VRAASADLEAWVGGWGSVHAGGAAVAWTCLTAHLHWIRIYLRWSCRGGCSVRAIEPCAPDVAASVPSLVDTAAAAARDGLLHDASGHQ
jgi:hypothetical protein